MRLAGPVGREQGTGGCEEQAVRLESPSPGNPSLRTVTLAHSPSVRHQAPVLASGPGRESTGTCRERTRSLPHYKTRDKKIEKVGMVVRRSCPRGKGRVGTDQPGSTFIMGDCSKRQTEAD